MRIRMGEQTNGKDIVNVLRRIICPRGMAPGRSGLCVTVKHKNDAGDGVEIVVETIDLEGEDPADSYIVFTGFKSDARETRLPPVRIKLDDDADDFSDTLDIIIH